MKKILLGLVLSFITLIVSAQDEAIFTHYIINPMLINPGATGLSGERQLFMHLKNQWTGFPGSPRTYGINYNGPVGERLGLGAMISSDNVASQSHTRGSLNYSFRLQVNQLNLGIGIYTAFERYRVTSSVYENKLQDQNDRIIAESLDGRRYFDAGIGVKGIYNNQFIFGLSLPNMIRARLGEIAGTSAQSSTFLKHYIFQMGYRHKTDEYMLEPSLVVRKVMGTPFQLDVNLLSAFLNDKLMAGLSYRAGNGGGGAMSILVGTKFNIVRLAYSYDVSFQRFQTYNSGAHEITLGLNFGGKSAKGPESDETIQRYQN